MNWYKHTAIEQENFRQKELEQQLTNFLEGIERASYYVRKRNPDFSGLVGIIKKIGEQVEKQIRIIENFEITKTQNIMDVPDELV